MTLILALGLCLAIALLVVLYQRAGSTHRPVISLLAWVLVVAAGSEAILLAFGRIAESLIPQIIINAVFLLSLLIHRGNIAPLFKGGCRLSDIIRGTKWRF